LNLDWADIDNNGLKNLIMEWIILGEVVKLDRSANRLPSIAEEIRESLVRSLKLFPHSETSRRIRVLIISAG
jgi:hypothetical protein